MHNVPRSQPSVMSELPTSVESTAWCPSMVQQYTHNPCPHTVTGPTYKVEGHHTASSSVHIPCSSSAFRAGLAASKFPFHHRCRSLSTAAHLQCPWMVHTAAQDHNMYGCTPVVLRDPTHGRGEEVQENRSSAKE
ncbi:unnamed protein product, partial [Ectocarpus sp. 8 AP-2014]